MHSSSRLAAAVIGGGGAETFSFRSQGQAGNPDRPTVALELEAARHRSQDRRPEGQV